MYFWNNIFFPVYNHCWSPEINAFFCCYLYLFYCSGLEWTVKYNSLVASTAFNFILKDYKHGRNCDLLAGIMLGFCFCGAGAPVQSFVNAVQVLCH